MDFNIKGMTGPQCHSKWLIYWVLLEQRSIINNDHAVHPLALMITHGGLQEGVLGVLSSMLKLELQVLDEFTHTLENEVCKRLLLHHKRLLAFCWIENFLPLGSVLDSTVRIVYLRQTHQKNILACYIRQSQDLAGACSAIKCLTYLLYIFLAFLQLQTT